MKWKLFGSIKPSLLSEWLEIIPLFYFKPSTAADIEREPVFRSDFLLINSRNTLRVPLQWHGVRQGVLPRTKMKSVTARSVEDGVILVFFTAFSWNDINEWDSNDLPSSPPVKVWPDPLYRLLSRDPRPSDWILLAKYSNWTQLLCRNSVIAIQPVPEKTEISESVEQSSCRKQTDQSHPASSCHSY